MILPRQVYFEILRDRQPPRPAAVRAPFREADVSCFGKVLYFCFTFRKYPFISIGCSEACDGVLVCLFVFSNVCLCPYVIGDSDSGCNGGAAFRNIAVLK